MAAGELHHHGARDTNEVHAVVLVEALVLGGDGAVLHVFGALVPRDIGAVLGVETRNRVALGIKHR